MSGKREFFSAVVSTGLGLQTAVGSPTPPAQPMVAPTHRMAKTLERISTMLNSLGYNVEPYINERGDIVGYHVTTDIDGKKQEFSFDLDPDGARLSLTAAVQCLPEKQKTAPMAFLTLLQTNAKIRPAYFTYDERSRQILVRLATFEAARTPDELRTQITDFCRIIRDTKDVWNLTGKTDTVIMQ